MRAAGDDVVKVCEFGHLMTQRQLSVGARVLVLFGHVNEGEAFQCSAFAEDGWPDSGDPIWRKANPGLDQTGTRPIPPVPTHALNKYGTTDCPVERVRAFADDGECSACGGRVIPPVGPEAP